MGDTWQMGAHGGWGAQADGGHMAGGGQMADRGHMAGGGHRQMRVRTYHALRALGGS